MAKPVQIWKPTRQQLLDAQNTTIPDILAENLRIVFCGINPSLYSAAIGHHFGRPGNRFWPTLYQAGFTPRLLSPFEDASLLEQGIGITNLVARATARADQLSDTEIEQGGQILVQKLRRFRPQAVAILGVTAYRIAFRQPKAQLGRQADPLGPTPLWVLPNPSGLNAHHRLVDLVALFAEFRTAVERLIAP